MCSSHYSVTLNAPKNNDTFYIKPKFSFFLCVALNSNVHVYVLMWSSRQQYVFFQFISYCMKHITCFFFFYILKMFFFFSYLTCFISIVV